MVLVTGCCGIIGKGKIMKCKECGDVTYVITTNVYNAEGLAYKDCECRACGAKWIVEREEAK